MREDDEMGVAVIQSEGDLEVVVLHEAHNALAAVIGPDLYSIGGTPSEQSCQFHSQPCFDLFLVLLVEFFAEGTRNAHIGGKYQNWSLMRGLQWLCTTYSQEAHNAALDTALIALDAWTKRQVQMRFWCADVNTDVQFILPNDRLVSFAANTTKHHLLRLSQLMGQVESLCEGTGYCFSVQELTSVLESMVKEVRSRMLYHATHILELLGTVFLALNRFIRGRFDANPTNCVSELTCPIGVTSDVFRNLYGKILIINRFDDARIYVHTPHTTRFLKLRYQ